MFSGKIAVVDDDPRIIQSLLLALDQYEVVSFTRAQDALDYLRRPNVVSVVLLDVFMNGPQGLELLAAIKKINEKIAVIIMTGYGTKDIAIEALRLHADDFVEKPFNVEDIQEKIRAVLKRKSPLAGQAGSSVAKIERMKQFIDRNCARVSLKDLSNELCLCPKYISRVFREKTKKSFRKYKLNRKIKIAKDMLCDSELSVNQIAEHLGYQNAESFMKTFKKIMECTPTEFRKKGRHSRSEVTRPH